jgi:rubrerythrin
MSLSSAVETAFKMETDAIKFYTEATGKTSHPLGKRIFEGFIEDEKRHLKMLDGIMRDMDIELNVVNPEKDIRTIFSELRDQMRQRISATTDEIQAVGIALDFEKEGYNFYQKAALEAKEDKEKRLFEILVVEEKRHYEILENTYRFLKDTGDWFMWDEHGILEG